MTATERRKYETPNGLLEAASEGGVDPRDFRMVPGVRALPLLDKVFDTFTSKGRGGRLRYWLWEDLKDPRSSLVGPEEPGFLLTYEAPETRVWLLVEESSSAKEGPPFWLFEATLGAAVAALYNYSSLEFYLVARDLSWLICQNHHDVWHASGARGVELLTLQAARVAVGE